MKDADGKALGKKTGAMGSQHPRNSRRGRFTWHSCWDGDLGEQKSVGVQVHFPTSWIWGWLLFLAFVVELGGVQAIELSTRHAVDIIPLSGRGLEMHQASQGVIPFETNTLLPCMFVPLLVELPCFCQALEYDWFSFSSFSYFWCHTKTLVWSSEVCNGTFNL